MSTRDDGAIQFDVRLLVPVRWREHSANIGDNRRVVRAFLLQFCLLGDGCCGLAIEKT